MIDTLQFGVVLAWQSVADLHQTKPRKGSLAALQEAVQRHPRRLEMKSQWIWITKKHKSKTQQKIAKQVSQASLIILQTKAT